MTRSDFEHIAAQLRPLMLRVALDFFGATDEAEDVTQEAQLALWRYCERIDSERNVEGLAVRVTKNCCVSWHRRHHSLPTVTDSSPSVTASALSPSPHELLEAKDAQTLLAEALARLTAIPTPRDESDVLFHATHVYYDKDGRMLVQLLARRTEYEDGDYRSLYLYYIDEGYDGAGIPQAARMTGKDLPALGGGWYWWSRREHRG